MNAVGLLLISSLLNLPQAVDPDSAVRATIEKSIPGFQDRVVWWIEKKKCGSCHRTGMMVWSLSGARRRGFAVSDQLDEWISWSIAETFKNYRPGMVLLPLARAGLDASDDSISAGRTFLVTTQKPDGTWAVRGTKANRKNQVQQPSVYWGATWAVIGLLCTLPDSDTKSTSGQ